MIFRSDLPPFLTDAELAAICDGLSQPHAMIRHLRAQGFTVKEKPNGRPLVSRANFETVMAGLPPPTAARAPATEPNSAAIVNLFGKRAVAR